MPRNLSVLAMLPLVAACGAGPEPELAGPDYSPIASQAVSPRGEPIIACLRQAMAAGRYDMIGDDGESRLIRFTCEGAEADALFNALGPRSARIGSEWGDGDILYRSTDRIVRDLYGLDIFDRDSIAYGSETGTYSRTFNLNTDAFLAG